jgi:Flp pilus assembly pilin Flp
VNQTYSPSRRQRQRGQGLVEYAIILSLVAVAAIVAVNLFGDGLTNTFSNFVGEGEFAPPSVGPLGGQFTPLPPSATPFPTDTPVGPTPTVDPLATATNTPTPSVTPTSTITPTATIDPSIPTNTPTPCPFGPYTIPGRVEMENFACGGQSVGYNDADTVNTGGQYRTDEGVDIDNTNDSDGAYHIGWTLPGEWLRYEINITTSAVYNLYLRFASTSGSGRVRVFIDGNDVSGLVNVPNTGGYDNWATLEIANVGLSSGARTVEVRFENGAINYNYFELQLASVPTETPTPTNTPTETPTPTETSTPTNTPTNTPVPSPTPGSGAVLFVAGSTTLNSNDQLMRNQIESLGYTVVVADDNGISAADANGKVLVVVSASAATNRVSDTFKDVELPFLTWKHNIQSEMKMSDAESGDNNETEINIINQGHPMAAGLSGLTTVYDSNERLRYGEVTSDAVLIATTDTQSDRHVLYGYDTCAAMVDNFPAPARRVFFFVDGDAADNLTSDGWALFNAAFAWSLGGSNGCGSSGPTTLFDDDFNRSDSNSLGGSWTELEESNATIEVDGNRMCFTDTSDRDYRPMASASFSSVNSGTLEWTYTFDWERSGNEGTYELFMQLGNGSNMTNNSKNNGIGVNLIWSQLSGTHEMLGHRNGGTNTSVYAVSGEHTIRVVADLDAHTYDLYVDGTVRKSNIPFDNNVSLDTVRFFTHSLNENNFSGRCFDNVLITHQP